jgi:hypothetical protein
VWATDQVCWIHYQVDGSSSGPDPLMGDDHEPGRWGPSMTPQVFLISIISANDRVKPIVTSQTLVNLGLHLENLITITNYPLNRVNTHPWSKI